MVDWQELAEKALKEEQKPISAEAATINKVAVGIGAAIGLLGPIAIKVVEPWGKHPAVEMASAAALAVAAILAIALIVAGDFTTRGRVTAARFAALAELASTPVPPSAATTASDQVSGSVATMDLSAKAGGETYDVLAVRWEGTSSALTCQYLLWRRGGRASWFAEHDVDSLVDRT
jgi:hypothetical protein